MKAAITAALFAVTLAAQDKFPDGPGKAVFTKVCGGCHGPEAVTGMAHDRSGWKEVVDEMVDKGATATPSEITQIVDYLAKAFPKKDR